MVLRGTQLKKIHGNDHPATQGEDTKAWQATTHHHAGDGTRCGVRRNLLCGSCWLEPYEWGPEKNIASHCWIWPLIRKCLRVVGLLKVLMFHSYLSLPYSLPMDSMCEVPCQPWWRVFVVMKRQAMGDSQQKLVQKQVRSKVYIVYYIYIIQYINPSIGVIIHRKTMNIFAWGSTSFPMGYITGKAAFGFGSPIWLV